MPTWIINVSSMEGRFRNFKAATHPHTNMAKAALNMMTHTSTREYARSADHFFARRADTRLAPVTFDKLVRPLMFVLLLRHGVG